MSGLPAEIETVHTQEIDCGCGNKEFYRVFPEKLFFHIKRRELFGEPTGRFAWVCTHCGKLKK